jgi:sulfur-carrier protein adenylyltransferase/sulfurtransferase
MLVGKGFKKIYNLSGGIRGWGSEQAVGPEDLGIDLFTGKETPEETLIMAYSLEEGLREFYLTMGDTVKNERARNLFQKLSDIEIKHQDRIFDEYRKVSASPVDRETFGEKVVTPAVEGGLTTEEYIDRFNPDIESVVEVVSLAMSIEAQALDLYGRAADRTGNEGGREVLRQIAAEEKTHLAQLGKLLDRF